MAKANLTPVPTETSRFTHDELTELFQKIMVCCAGVAAEWEAYNSGGSYQRRHFDNALILSQVAGFIADHAAHDCGGYGDLFDWLEIPRGVQS